MNLMPQNSETCPERSRRMTTQPRSKLQRNLDEGFVWLTKIFALAIAGILIWITVVVAMEALPAMEKFGWEFLITTNWNPVEDQYGALPQLYGTLITSLIALILAAPIGLGVAIFLSEDFLPTRLQLAVVFLVELLAAIPSVVYGLWGIFVLVPILKDLGIWLHSNFNWIPIFNSPPSATGLGILPSGVVLTIMILPTIASLSRDALNSLPPDLRQASLGLGATRWETIIQILVPAAFSGIVGAIMLALGRALGETMAVTMIIGNANKISPSILAASNTVASLLANQFAEADKLQISALMYAALMLFLMTLIVNILAEILIRRVQRI